MGIATDIAKGIKNIGGVVVDTNVDVSTSLDAYKVDQIIVIGADGKPHTIETNTEHVDSNSGSISFLQADTMTAVGYNDTQATKGDWNLATPACLLLAMVILFLMIKGQRRQKDSSFLRMQ